MTSNIPKEFDITTTGNLDKKVNPFGIGYTMRGWDFSTDELEDALRNGTMLNPALELSSNACPWNCFFCFTEDPDNPEETKKRLENEMTLDEKLDLIDQAKALGAKSINLIGAGEPTIAKDFWPIIEHIDGHGMTPIVYTEGSLKLTDRDFAQRLYDMNATVVLKVNSLENESYQNSVVRGGKERRNPLKTNYFEERNKALEVLMDVGFNNHDSTRLAIDTIICRENYEEIPSIHRFARDNNIFSLLVGYLPSGRSSTTVQGAVSREEQFDMFKELARIDMEQYGIEHSSGFPYAGAVPCTIRGLGIYGKIEGDVLACPGESEILGNFRDGPREGALARIWDKTKSIRDCFDGGCEPRELAWREQESIEV